jgi:tRNA-splicing ligase RtcB
MTQVPAASSKAWLAEPLPREVSQSIDRLRACDDVAAVAIMPDVHLAREVCVGAVVATRRLIYPAAVGGDIGCGMAAIAFDADAALVDNERAAASVLSGLYELVPANKHRRPRDFPPSLHEKSLSDARLARIAARDGRVQLGTLGRGNHFLELQADHDGRLWAMVHSGSRAVGQAIAEWHARSGQGVGSALKWLDADGPTGQAYLSDATWARSYAAENRLAMLHALDGLLRSLFAVNADWKTLIHADHNHVQREWHGNDEYWVHRKGAQSAAADEPGVVPGSMGAPSFHTAGRGCAESLRSCSHGAGRRLSRGEARQSISGAEFQRQVGWLWYDHRRAFALRDEAPGAYKDIREVMRAQRDLAKIVCELRPVLGYKGA